MKTVKNISTIAILFVISITGFIIFTFFQVHLDFSKNKAYTLAPATKKTIQSIKNPLSIQVFVSSDLPTKLLPLKTDVLELLREYERSGKYIKVSILDPKNDTKALEKAKEYNLPQVQFSQLQQNNYQITAAYFGIVVIYKDKTEIIPQVTDYANLEYNLTSAIYRIIRDSLPNIAIVGEEEEILETNSDPLLYLKRALSQQYVITSVQLNTITQEEKERFFKKYSAIIVSSSETQQYDKEQVELLKEYFQKGGKIILFSKGVSINEQMLGAASLDSPINQLIASYGAVIKNNLVLSTAAEYVNFGNNQSQYLVAYPFWIRTNTLNEKTGLFANIQYVSFPWVSEITLSQKKDIKVTPLILSSARSWQQTEPFVLSPDTLPQPKISDLREFILAALLENNQDGKIVLIGSSRFAYSQYVSQGSGNIDFILNSIDTFTSKGALNGIRSRSLSVYPIADMSEMQKNIYMYSGILLFPLLWSIVNAIRLIKRK